jgi:hypothetical protein
MPPMGIRERGSAVGPKSSIMRALEAACPDRPHEVLRRGPH